MTSPFFIVTSLNRSSDCYQLSKRKMDDEDPGCVHHLQAACAGHHYYNWTLPHRLRYALNLFFCAFTMRVHKNSYAFFVKIGDVTHEPRIRLFSQNRYLRNKTAK